MWILMLAFLDEECRKQKILTGQDILALSRSLTSKEYQPSSEEQQKISLLAATEN